VEHVDHVADRVGEFDTRLWRSSKPALELALESGEPDDVADAVRMTEILESLRRDLSHATQHVLGKAFGRRKPRHGAAEHDAWNGSQFRLELLESRRTQLGCRDEPVWLHPGRVEILPDPIRVGRHESFKRAQHAPAVLDSPWFDSDDDDLARLDEWRAIVGKDRRAVRPRHSKPQPMAGR